MSPPCVAFFQGDNGGATYQGVTRDEITVLAYVDTGTYNVGDSVENSPAGGQYCDLDQAPNSGGPGCYVSGGQTDHKLVQIARAYARHFNDRYQVYGRRVHFWMYWVSARTAAGKRSDAEANFNRLRPFAVIDQTGFSGDEDAYTDAMVRRGVFVFPGQSAGNPGNGAQPAGFFQRYSPLVWSFIPDVEHWAAGYSSYVCTKVAPHPVAHAQGGFTKDGQLMNGQRRRFGLVYSNDERFPSLQHLANLVRAGLRKCGVTPPVEVAGVEDVAGAVVGVARLRDGDVTTVLVAGPAVTNLSNAADSAKYYPEVVIAGDAFTDRNLTARIANQNFMRNAWVISYLIGFYSLEEDFGYRACREGDTNLSRSVCQFGSTRFRDNYILFKVLQVAGPRLRPETVDRGMHAIARYTSKSYSEAACFFDSGDFSCVKDFIEEWWDGVGRPPGAQSPGCWRMVRGGQRFVAGQWPPGEDVFANPNDPCNAYTLGGPYDA